MSPEDGFTLIELLVVIVIIGILAAIAIPVYLNQRQKAADTAARSDLVHVAQAEESYLASSGSYGLLSAVASAQGLKLSKGTYVGIVFINSTKGYCLAAWNTGGSDIPSNESVLSAYSGGRLVYIYDSQSGGMQAVSAFNAATYGCPVTNSGSGAAPVNPPSYITG